MLGNFTFTSVPVKTKHSLKQGEFRMDIRKKIFMGRVVRNWRGLQRVVVECPCLEVPEDCLDMAFSAPGW